MPAKVFALSEILVADRADILRSFVTDLARGAGLVLRAELLRRGLGLGVLAVAAEAAGVAQKRESLRVERPQPLGPAIAIDRPISCDF